MNTDALIDSLSAGVPRIGAHAVGRRLALGLAVGMLVTFAIVIGVLGIRYDFTTAIHGPTIWMKWGYTAALAIVAVAAMDRLARPEARRANALWFALLPALVLAGIAVAQLATTPRADWMALWIGHSARECPVRVTVLAVPIFLGLLWSFRRFAPTRLRLTGAAAGFAAGAAAATCYGFACPETSAVFVVTWYTLGIAISSLLGALVGPRLLRW